MDIRLDTCQSCGFTSIKVDGVSIAIIKQMNTGKSILELNTYKTDSTHYHTLKESGLKMKRAKGAGNRGVVYYKEYSEL